MRKTFQLYSLYYGLPNRSQTWLHCALEIIGTSVHIPVAITIEKKVYILSNPFSWHLDILKGMRKIMQMLYNLFSPKEYFTQNHFYSQSLDLLYSPWECRVRMTNSAVCSELSIFDYLYLFLVQFFLILGLLYLNTFFP